MVSLFLSYAREDEEVARMLTQELTKRGVSVWRDRESLYGGQNWPRALGEAIAANEFVVLLWSSHAGTSEFVELEWCTGFALKKTILPCLLDDTPLPASLVAIHSIVYTNPRAAISLLLQSLHQETARIEPAQKNAVLSKLTGVRSHESSEIRQIAKDLRDKPSGRQGKTVLEKWQSWVALLVGVLLAITLAVRLPDEVARPFFAIPHSEEMAAEISQPLGGSIWNEEGDLLAEVKVSLPNFSQMVETNSLGRFEFEVKAPFEEQVEVLAQKEGFRTEKLYATLGNRNLNFSMQRKRS